MEALKTLFQKGNDLLADSIATLESFDPSNDRGWMTELGVERRRIRSLCIYQEEDGHSSFLPSCPKT